MAKMRSLLCSQCSNATATYRMTLHMDCVLVAVQRWSKRQATVTVDNKAATSVTCVGLRGCLIIEC